MQFLKGLWTKVELKLHQHDYDMVFDEAPSLRYKFVCKYCGDIQSTMTGALRKQGRLGF